MLQFYYFPLQIRRRQEIIRRQPLNIEIHLVDLPRLLHPPPLVLHGVAVPEERGHRLPSVRHVDPFDAAVVPDEGGDVGLPEDAVVGPHRLDHLHQLGVAELDEQPGLVAEVAPNGVVEDLGAGRALELEDGVVGVELEDEAVLVLDLLLADEGRLDEQFGHAPGVQSLVFRHQSWRS
ncbi:unnamed protein product [Linum trigynum]|uniref:Uncharacterized protein n=1 Tax=Linum trigynum TaxID=586398 RepID=A0AAV2CHX8_9ROSI